MQTSSCSLHLLQATLKTMLANASLATPGAGALKSAHVALATALPAYAPVVDPAAVTEADYTGDARLPIVWGTAGVGSDGRAALPGGSLTFSPTDSVKPNTIVGVALYDALTAGNLIGLANFDNPVALIGPDSDLVLVPVVAMPAGDSPDYGSLSVIK